MKNKRLLIILIILISIGTIGILGGVVFSVASSSFEISFANELDVLAKKGTSDQTTAAVIENNLKQEVAPLLVGKNVIFSIDREVITDAVENCPAYYPRIRVTNFEAKFPNRVTITIRERYAVFVYKSGDIELTLDGELMILELAASGGRGLIDISNLAEVNHDNIAIGAYLDIEENIRKRVLADLTPIFASEESFEDSLSHMFTAIDFLEERGSEIDVKLTLRVYDGRIASNTFIIIEDIEDEAKYLEKLTKAWQVLAICGNEPGVYRVYEHMVSKNVEADFTPA